MEILAYVYFSKPFVSLVGLFVFFVCLFFVFFVCLFFVFFVFVFVYLFFLCICVS